MSKRLFTTFYLFVILTACKQNSASYQLQSAATSLSSIFEQLVVEMDHHQVIYPFDLLVDFIEKHGSPAVQVLVPLGRSAQRFEAKPNYFDRPRRLVSFLENPAHGEGKSPDIGAKLFLGYIDPPNGTHDATQIEVISYNQSANKFDFLLVNNYGPGRVPIISKVQPESKCTVCHSEGLPIFSKENWEESNSLDEMIDLLLHHHPTGKIGKFAVSPRPLGAYPGGVEQFDFDFHGIRYAQVLLEMQNHWRSGCGIERRKKILRRGDEIKFWVATKLGLLSSVPGWEFETNRLVSLKPLDPFELRTTFIANELPHLSEKERLVFNSLSMEEQLAYVVLDRPLPKDLDPKTPRNERGKILGGEFMISWKHIYKLATTFGKASDIQRSLVGVTLSFDLNKSKLGLGKPFAVIASASGLEGKSDGQVWRVGPAMLKFECTSNSTVKTCKFTDVKNAEIFSGSLKLQDANPLQGSVHLENKPFLPVELACSALPTGGDVLQFRCTDFDEKSWQASWDQYVKLNIERQFSGLEADFFYPDQIFSEFLSSLGQNFSFSSNPLSSVRTLNDQNPKPVFDSSNPLHPGLTALVHYCHLCHGLPQNPTYPPFLVGGDYQQTCESLQSFRTEVERYLSQKSQVKMPPEDGNRLEFLSGKSYADALDFLRKETNCMH